MAMIATPEDVSSFHLNSDRDSSPLAQHHTLGVKPNQASPGNHTHNGQDSARINFSDIEGGIFNIDGGKPDSNYGSIPALDCGGVI